MAIIEQKPPQSDEKTFRAKNKNSHPAEAGWEKADHDESRTWHPPREGRAVPRQSTTALWTAF